MRNKQVIVVPERTRVLLRHYNIYVVRARDGIAYFTVEKANKKLRGVKYETIIIDEACEKEKE